MWEKDLLELVHPEAVNEVHLIWQVIKVSYLCIVQGKGTYLCTRVDSRRRLQSQVLLVALCVYRLHLLIEKVP